MQDESESKRPQDPREADLPRVREAASSDRKAINAVIGRAFYDDPVAEFIFPNPRSRRNGFGAFAELAMDQFVGSGVTYVDDPIRGAAIWQGPSPARTSFAHQLGMAWRLLLTLQRQIRTLPKPVIAMVAGYAVGGGHVLHMMCDLTIAADNAKFGQTGPRVGSFDGGYGASYMARIVGQKRAREIWFLCRMYDAQRAYEMGLVNCVVPYERLEEETIQWCREILANSPMAIRVLKAALNADCDGQAGLQELAGNATLLFYMTPEAQEGRDAFKEKRKPDFSKFPRFP